MKMNHSLPLEYSTKQNDLNIFGFWVFLACEIMLVRNTIYILILL